MIKNDLSDESKAKEPEAEKIEELKPEKSENDSQQIEKTKKVG